ncbi:hypothetical protein OGAPHI_000398 [Ogataea philodendri]|uniref:Secreted protein n=1 Tax=Ogataea philodendri TaxID=1378263 RepID=A0A9P8PG99_9ASCO|nr:uncharacterized protein OGAPHI_000398 [Ogataea philodendri]KAH3671693.1 hypothetical protein OGAPHI_000398 [Ogataea philodendri]
MYICARFSTAVACWITASTWATTETGSPPLSLAPVSRSFGSKIPLIFRLMVSIATCGCKPFESASSTVLVLPYNLHGHLAGLSERSLVSRHPHGRSHVLGQSERNTLWNSKFLTFVEETVKVNMENLSGQLAQHDVVSVTITHSNQIPNNRHHSTRFSVVVSALVPIHRVRELVLEPNLQHRLVHLGEFLEVVDLFCHRKLLVQQLLDLAKVHHNSLPLQVRQHDISHSFHVVHPLNQPHRLVQRNNGVVIDGQVPFVCFRIQLQQSVHDSGEFHQLGVLSQVVMRLAQDTVSATVCACDVQSPRTLHRRQDTDLGIKVSERNKLVNLVVIGLSQRIVVDTGS